MKIGRKLTIFSWAMYDFANTIFAMNVITLYFALWVTIDKQGEDILYSIALSISMLLSALTAPWLGAISDHIKRRKPFLITFTIVSCCFTALIGLANQLWLGLIFFAIANYCFQVADIFYNTLLPQISGGKVGRVSGYGVSLGYCGTIVGLLLVSPFALKWGRQATFIPTGFFFLLFALPCFFFVKDTLTQETKKTRLKFKETLLSALLKIKTTILYIRNYPGFFSFLLAIFIAFNAINTIYIFMSVYTKKIIGFTDPQIITFYIVSSFFAIFGAFFAGFITDKFGPKRTLTGVLLLWCAAVFAAMLAKTPIIFWIIGPTVGISLGSTWTSARALAVKLSPPEMIGETFGFYGLVGKTSSIVGPLIWGLTIWSLHFLGLVRYRIAVGVLLLFLLLGLAILQRIP